jgi:hypothetical protein
LIQDWILRARKHGRPAHQIVSWVRRKVGPVLCTWRFLVNGELGCATPCLLCSRELQRFGFKTFCSQGGEEWFRGELGAEGAPVCKLTSTQERYFGRLGGQGQQEQGQGQQGQGQGQQVKQQAKQAKQGKRKIGAGCSKG